MSYDISLVDPITRETLELDSNHHMKGGTYAMGGTSEASLKVTYNYAPHYYKTVGEGGIRTLYGLSGAQSLSLLDKAISELGDDVDPDYWKATEGNAKRSLIQLKALAEMRPDRIWSGD